MESEVSVVNDEDDNEVVEQLVQYSSAKIKHEENHHDLFEKKSFESLKKEGAAF